MIFQGDLVQTRFFSRRELVSKVEDPRSSAVLVSVCHHQASYNFVRNLGVQIYTQHTTMTIGI
jgi:hypothetical protein